MLDLHEFFSFNQLVEEPTRLTLITSSIIDHIATTSARHCVKSVVHDVSLVYEVSIIWSTAFENLMEKWEEAIK